MSELGRAVRDALSQDGALATTLAGFAPRDAQRRMAAAVVDALESTGTLLAEAGTGTGKTYAYLVPALLSGRRVIVSTGTRALQDQLFLRDLPKVRAALGLGIRSALLKGRANYLCWHRLELTKADPRNADGPLADSLVRIQAWSGRTERGDIGELHEIAEDSPLWPQVTSTTENCVGADCPFYGECFVVRARQRAQEADLVVVNHHLLLADLALKQEGFGDILPGAQAFILDEAHQLPELASQFFGIGLSARQLTELGRDALAEARQMHGASSTLRNPVSDLDQRLREARESFEGLPSRAALGRALEAPAVADTLAGVEAALTALIDALEPLRASLPGLEACAVRAGDLRTRLERILRGDEPGSVRWYELSARGFTLQLTPLDVAGPLRQYRQRSGAAWIFTSATLAVSGQFHHIARQLGLDEPATLVEPSPFDYPHQAMAWLPRGLAEPGSRDSVARMLDVIEPVLRAANGRAFLLFTSHRALREAAELLDGRLPFPLFVQGSLPRTRLLDAFRAAGNGVLLGAASFREGVDVAGDALSVVVIEKLPFAAPDDPVLEARLEAIRNRGGVPFRDWQLPTAVIAFKQGIGRLIRTHADRGLLVLCDTRLVTKPYGKVFTNSLPPMPRTRDLDDALAFLAQLPPPAQAAPLPDPPADLLTP